MTDMICLSDLGEDMKNAISQFRGIIQRARGEASRLGNKESGLRVHGDAWSIGASVSLHHDDVKDQDLVSIALTSGNNKHSPSIFLGSFRESDIRNPLIVADALEHAAKVIRQRETVTA